MNAISTGLHHHSDQKSSWAFGNLPPILNSTGAFISVRCLRSVFSARKRRSMQPLFTDRGLKSSYPVETNLRMDGNHTNASRNCCFRGRDNEKCVQSWNKVGNNPEANISLLWSRDKREQRCWNKASNLASNRAICCLGIFKNNRLEVSDQCVSIPTTHNATDNAWIDCSSVMNCARDHSIVSIWDCLLIPFPIRILSHLEVYLYSC